MSSNKVGIVGR